MCPNQLIVDAQPAGLEQVQSVAIRNIGEGVLTISDVRADESQARPAASFSLRGVPNVPLTLAPGGLVEPGSIRSSRRPL
ncbi:MAG: hypothetical protein AAFV53_03465 [Myxococcota bacterium]